VHIACRTRRLHSHCAASRRPRRADPAPHKLNVTGLLSALSQLRTTHQPCAAEAIGTHAAGDSRHSMQRSRWRWQRAAPACAATSNWPSGWPPRACWGAPRPSLRKAHPAPGAAAPLHRNPRNSSRSFDGPSRTPATAWGVLDRVNRAPTVPASAWRPMREREMAKLVAAMCVSGSSAPKAAIVREYACTIKSASEGCCTARLGMITMTTTGAEIGRACTASSQQASRN
jgi:hypothetical protein